MQYIKQFSKELVLISLLILVVTSLNLASYSFLLSRKKEFLRNIEENFVHKIESILIDDFKRIFASQNSTDFTLIKNFQFEDRSDYSKDMYFSNNILSIAWGKKSLIADISNVSKLLAVLASGTFLYKVYIDDVIIFSNTQDNLVENKSKSIPISIHQQMTIKVENDKNSKFVVQSNIKLLDLTKRIFVTSVFLTIFLTLIIYLFCKREKELTKQTKLYENALAFFDESREFILRCYKQSKKSSSKEGQEYFPISIVSEEGNRKENTLILKDVVNQVQKHLEIYIGFYQMPARISIMSDLNTIKSILCEDELYQLITSIIYNLLHFNKKGSRSNETIIKIKEEEIEIFSEGVKLNQKYAIQASETIFYEYANPYILKLGQVLVLLIRNGIKCNISPSNKGTKIVVGLKNSVDSSEEKERVVIDFERHRGKK